MSLADYRRKRNFARTPEPKGRTSKSTTGRFVIHKHAARNLHYDLRLEIGGVLKSWAVPKGPCLDPAEKRLAVETEDHPLEYLDFEGVIPAGEYGAGSMIVWDRGEWTPEGDLEASLRKGQLKLQLRGEKLQGRWALVKIKPRPGEPDRNWLFFKERGENTRPLADGDILKDLPHSVLSGRTIEEVAVIENHRGKRPHTKSRQRTQTAPRAAQPILDMAALPAAQPAALPKTLQPQLATLAAAPPEGDRWLHEIKFDGYRLLCFIDEETVRLLTRRQNDWTKRFPHLVAAAKQLPVQSAILDGEVVGLLPNGASSFPVLQAALKQRHPQSLVYFVFDLLYCNGCDLRRTPLECRKSALAQLLQAGGQTALQYVDHVDGHGRRFFAECRRLGLEGVVSKRRDRPSRSGRTSDWLKSKCVQRDEFVIGGFTEPSGSRSGLGALLVGVFDDSQQLIYAGKVGTGFDEQTLKDLRRSLDDIERKSSPFAGLPRGKIDKGTHWVQPNLVAQVQYAGWSADELLWHPVFQGLRDDVVASSVVRETSERRARPVAPGPPAAATPLAEVDAVPPARLAELADVRMTHPERVMYAEPRITKLDLARFYVAIAEWILPHVVNRPLSLLRCPDGQGTTAFFQKHPGIGTPREIRRVRINGEEHLMIDDLAGLVSLVQIGVLEIHPWGARCDRPDRPDRLIFDLDPADDVPWHRVVATAWRLRDLLQEAGLTSFIKTTGGKGLHVVLPVERRHAWTEAKKFTQAVARQLVAEQPGLYTTSPMKQARRGRIFIDINRNSQGATAIAPYSTRNRSGAPVAVPLDWSELSEHIAPDQFTVQNLIPRLAALQADPWADIGTVRQALTARVWKAFRR